MIGYTSPAKAMMNMTIATIQPINSIAITPLRLAPVSKNGFRNIHCMVTNPFKFDTISTNTIPD